MNILPDDRTVVLNGRTYRLTYWRLQSVLPSRPGVYNVRTAPIWPWTAFSYFDGQCWRDVHSTPEAAREEHSATFYRSMHWRGLTEEVR